MTNRASRPTWHSNAWTRPSWRPLYSSSIASNSFRAVTAAVRSLAYCRNNDWSRRPNSPVCGGRLFSRLTVGTVTTYPSDSASHAKPWTDIGAFMTNAGAFNARDEVSLVTTTDPFAIQKN